MPKTKICKKCGAQMDKSAKACPQCGAPAKGKKGLIIAGIIVAIVVIPIAAGSSNETSSNTPTVVSKADTSVESTAAPSDDSKNESQSDESANESLETESQTQSNIFHIGDVVDTGDATITLTSVNDYTTDNMFMQPNEGNKYICASFVIENTGKSDLFTTPYDFNCYADNASVDSRYFDDHALSSDSISPGRKKEGNIWFELPESAKTIEIEYEMSWWTQEKAIFIVKE